MSMESSESLMEEIGAQALNTAAFQPLDAALQAIDAVTQSDVVKVGKFSTERITVSHTNQLKYVDISLHKLLLTS